jgi:hypothetical protein
MLTALDTFIRPLIGSIAWGVRQGYGSFLYFHFGEPKLVVRNRAANKFGRPERDAQVEGSALIWIYCCHWRILDGERQIAFSEDDDKVIAMGTAFLNGQNLIGIETANGRSIFRFDLDGVLETWPYEDGDDSEQWIISRDDDYFDYRGDGLFWQGPGNTVPDDKVWSPLT